MAPACTVMAVSAPRSRRLLLGHLAGFGWFTRMGEPAATQAVAVLLREPELRAATLDLITDRTGVDLSAVERFFAEVVADDRARPDLEGLDEYADPLLVVEMKFGAHLGPSQLRAYLRNQAARLRADRERVLVVLVPERRRAESVRVLESAVQTWATEVGDLAEQVRSTVVSWDEWLSVWEEAAPDDGDPRSIAADVAQLRSLCDVLSGLVIEPFDIELANGEWLTRLDDLRRLSDAVSRRVGEVNPMGDEVQVGYLSRRYVLAGGPTPRTSLAIGVQARFAEEGMTPLWARIHNATPGYSKARSIVLNSPLGTAIREDHGHLWIPLILAPELSGPALIEMLETQVLAIKAVLRNGE